jgi:hypothetical protein
MASLPWSILAFSGDTGDTPGWKRLDEFLKARLRHMEPVLARREWLAGTFSVADILMADVLRLVDRFDGLAGHPASRDYAARATVRPSFVKAHADQMAHFAAADCSTSAPRQSPNDPSASKETRSGASNQGATRDRTGTPLSPVLAPCDAAPHRLDTKCWRSIVTPATVTRIAPRCGSDPSD